MAGLEDQLNRIESMLLSMYGPGMSSETLLHHQSHGSDHDHGHHRSEHRSEPERLRSTANPLLASSISPNDPRYSSATIIDAKGQSKPVYR
jgi:hypothetical protein